MRVLIVEDDKDAAGFLAEGLEGAGFMSALAYDGDTALERARSAQYDAILLDVEMPEPNGFAVLKTLRKEGCRSAILMVTCRGNETDRLTGLNGGADDYIVKPFLIREVIARVQTVLRRTQPAPHKSGEPTVLELGNLRMDLLKRRVEIKGREIDLTKKEFDLLAYFLRHPDEALTKPAITQHIADSDFIRDTNFLEAHVHRLRDKLDGRGGPVIETVRGVGYRLTQ